MWTFVDTGAPVFVEETEAAPQGGPVGRESTVQTRKVGEMMQLGTRLMVTDEGGDVYELGLDEGGL